MLVGGYGSRAPLVHDKKCTADSQSLTTCDRDQFKVDDEFTLWEHIKRSQLDKWLSM